MSRTERENERGENPTLFEYTRKGLEIPANMVWLSTSGGAQQRNLVYSSHPDYGEKYGANLIDAAGVFNTEFQKVIDSFGTPSVPRTLSSIGNTGSSSIVPRSTSSRSLTSTDLVHRSTSSPSRTRTVHVPAGTNAILNVPFVVESSTRLRV